MGYHYFLLGSYGKILSVFPQVCPVVGYAAY